MAVFRIEKTRDYTVMSNHHLRDTGLSLGHTYDEPKRWQLHNINEIMNTVVTGWKPFSNPRMFAGYGRQKGWERDVSGNELPGNEDGFVELSEEECRQLELPKEWIA